LGSLIGCRTIWQNFVELSILCKYVQHIETSHVDEFDDFGEFGNILSNLPNCLTVMNFGQISQTANVCKLSRQYIKACFGEYGESEQLGEMLSH